MYYIQIDSDRHPGDLSSSGMYTASIRMTNTLMSIIEVWNGLLIRYLYILHTVFRIHRYML